ncbi:hypothetical protein MSP8886_02292 [Marinomonas spartinae]|uniref:Uncharacterized protein n=1 Tax=Marinomonas spartinae TaxID=1792290 RepID=A0A1A8THV0_9GAMM|nr:hypothetical protein [Marinomonas spartinae]SBS31955.1 hypothetical protein MSP8886_02292 [Marinomonas spartinae]
MTLSISKQNHQENPDSFEQLFQLGLTYIQQLSGKVWTDYNTHDPGVTILEQLCYALTDLIYRSDFDVSDYLTESNGQIDYRQYGLTPPEEILQPPPQQPSDYQSWLLSVIPDLDQVWVALNQQAPHCGLYQIDGLLPVVSQQEQSDTSPSILQTIRAISQAYHSVRGLGEDLDQVRIIGETSLSLHAIIDISNEVDDINKLAASIYDQSNQWIRQEAVKPTLTELKEHLLANNAIQHIHDLYFQSTDASNLNKRLETLPEHAKLMLPEQESDITLALFQNNHAVTLDVSEIGLNFHLYQQHRHIQQTAGSSAKPALPAGRLYNFAQYESVQTLFPRNYHLAPGRSSHYNPQQQAERHQLRSYLLLFDQLMANFCRDLDGIRELFSLSLDTPYSYQIQALSHEQFYDIDQHYPAQAEQQLRELQAQFDDFPERKGRLFDYILALYGEQYPNDFHRQFNPYLSFKELNWQLLKNKQAFLHDIITVTNERGLGPNLFQADHQSGYEKRISLLLGIQKTDKTSYTRTLTRHLLNVVSDAHFAHSPTGQKTLFNIRKPIRSLLESVSERPENITLSDRKIRRIRSSIIAFTGQTIPESLFLLGIDHHCFKVLHHTRKDEYQLFFNFSGKPSEDDDKRWLYIGRHTNKNKLLNFCHYLQQWLTQLNHEIESLHLVEHITLRPQGESDDLAPYAHQISVVLPGFTARHHNEHFRQQAEALIRNNSPAHLLAHIHWLSFHDFCEFETLYFAWREQKAKVLNLSHSTSGYERQNEQQDCDQLADKLHTFLQQPSTQDDELIL